MKLIWKGDLYIVSRLSWDKWHLFAYGIAVGNWFFGILIRRAK